MTTQNRQEQKPAVLISGAGFGGLAAAWWMSRLGYAVTVVEIARDLRKGGTPVDIREGVLDVVKRMGLLERIAAHSLQPRSMSFLDARGQVVAAMTAEARETADPGYEIERDVLLDMLFREVENDVEFLFGNSIAGLRQSAEEVTVTFADGSERAYSLVLGCDGTHSAVRRLCFGEEAEFSLFLQRYFSLTIVDKLLIEENTGQMYNEPGKAVMLTAYNGKTDIALCFFSDEEICYDRRDAAEGKRLIRQHLASAGWRTPELLTVMGECDNFYFDKLCQIRMQSWTHGRVALVGDAGYCPSPAAGMGGSMAILGAAALADALAKHPGDLQQALRDYDETFRPVVEGIQTQAVEFGVATFMPSSEKEIEARNAFLLAAGA